MGEDTQRDAFTDRRGLRVMGLEECLERLRTVQLARVAWVRHGEAEVLPVMLGVEGTTLVFRTTWGSKFELAASRSPVTVEADDVDLEAGHGWSVVVKGTAAVEYDGDAVDRLEALQVPYWVHDGAETFWVRVTPEEVSGREITAELPR